MLMVIDRPLTQHGVYFCATSVPPTQPAKVLRSLTPKWFARPYADSAGKRSSVQCSDRAASPGLNGLEIRDD